MVNRNLMRQFDLSEDEFSQELSSAFQENTESWLPSEEMYLSGPPLHVLAMHCVERWRAAWDYPRRSLWGKGSLDVTFSPIAPESDPHTKGFQGAADDVHPSGRDHAGGKSRSTSPDE